MSSYNDLTGSVRFTQTQDLSIPTLSILAMDGSIRPDAVESSMDKTTATKIYRDMVYIRVLDQRMIAAQRQGRLSFYLTCTGEEAAVVGSVAGFESQDMIMSQYREQAALRYRGFLQSSS